MELSEFKNTITKTFKLSRAEQQNEKDRGRNQ